MSGKDSDIKKASDSIKKENNDFEDRKLKEKDKEEAELRKKIKELGHVPPT